jgi:serine/threonine-protein kinase HipA
MGRRANQLDPRKARLAMAVVDRNRHYDLHGIHRWHWVAMARKLGLPDAPALIEGIVQRTPAVLDATAARLPRAFPEYIFDAISKGMRQAAKRLASEPDAR